LASNPFPPPSPPGPSLDQELSLLNHAWELTYGVAAALFTLVYMVWSRHKDRVRARRAADIALARQIEKHSSTVSSFGAALERIKETMEADRDSAARAMSDFAEIGRDTNDRLRALETDQGNWRGDINGRITRVEAIIQDIQMSMRDTREKISHLTGRVESLVRS
jgi:chromosome segregation ATPase